MQDEQKRTQPSGHDSTEPSTQNANRQEQSDPQLTELKGFVDKKEDLEPTLTDGTKVPDKAKEENRQNGYNDREK
ncbi:hypothetical protein [Flavisolibacter ginsenosidimutans]|uniref:Uncharacterized protein n=1 Tax=Flavisolibacter ginsenosidimutans TaxID=661481 RepID=A0A5B8UEQ5_9BACT|nr:hypothetical protein [Flavisolibacter ginsenosidimutans]QEC54786.1 hypothetical protein FSB75_02345 [Flavisolibacter ginsenosidimutans]